MLYFSAVPGQVLCNAVECLLSPMLSLVGKAWAEWAFTTDAVFSQVKSQKKHHRTLRMHP